MKSISNEVDKCAQFKQAVPEFPECCRCQSENGENPTTFLTHALAEFVKTLAGYDINHLPQEIKYFLFPSDYEVGPVMCLISVISGEGGGKPH